RDRQGRAAGVEEDRPGALRPVGRRHEREGRERHAAARQRQGADRQALRRTLMELGPAGRRLLAASRALALAGGAIFVLLVAMSVVSIVGRKLFSMPVPGDVELLQMTAACACACFFAYCHLMDGDVRLDLLTS